MSRRDDAGFGHSMTDLMSGVAATFLLIAAIFMVQAFAARMKEAAAEQKTKADLERIQNKDRVAREFLEQLLLRFTADPTLSSVVEPEYDELKDPYLLTLTLNRNRFLFPSEGCELSREMTTATQTDLKEAVRAVCDATGAGERILSIVLEGHTDNRPFFPRRAHCGAEVVGCMDDSTPECRAVGFENNVRLSGARAQNVFFALQRAIGQGDLASCLERFFVVAGRGPVEPAAALKNEPAEDEAQTRARNRRVVIKVRVRAGASLGQASQ